MRALRLVVAFMSALATMAILEALAIAAPRAGCIPPLCP